MSPVRPPPDVAVWLLRRLVPGKYADALAGDLHELYRQGRSDFWYWREVISAIVILRANHLRLAGSRLTKTVVAGFALLALGIGTFSWAHSLRTDVGTHGNCHAGNPARPEDCRAASERLP